MAEQLTRRQNAFVAELLAGANPVEAAARAGYRSSPQSTAKRLLKNPRITAALADAGEPPAAPPAPTPPGTPTGEDPLGRPGNGLEEIDVVGGLMAEARFTGKGASHSARVSAWEKLGKHLGMFKDKSATANLEEIVIKWKED